MFGRRWEKAEATIVASLPTYTGDGSTVSYEFVADIRPVSGAPAFRATLKEPMIATDFWRPNLADVVSVLVKSNGKVKFDTDDPRISAKAYEASSKAVFETARNQTFAPAQRQQTGVPVFSSGDPGQIRAVQEKLRAAGLGGLADQISQATNLTAGNPVSADPAARLATLENLRDRGLLTDAEFAAQRQRILNDL